MLKERKPQGLNTGFKSLDEELKAEFEGTSSPESISII